MAKVGLMFVVALLSVSADEIAARIYPAHATPTYTHTGFTDEKNFVNYGGLGGYFGVGSNGFPFGGISGRLGTTVGTTTPGAAGMGNFGGFGGPGSGAAGRPGAGVGNGGRPGAGVGNGGGPGNGNGYGAQPYP